MDIDIFNFKSEIRYRVLSDDGVIFEEVGWIGTEGALHYTWRIMCRRDVIPVRMVFLTPFDPSHCNDRKEIAQTAREQIRRALSASLGGKPVL